ncbi:hypothetical protein RI129_005075 [Pyrocoelia pectoralis]|uniref:Rab3 GTPase-activating protein catalytic subunit n=1 Tax=Pyrocoelia pectoralis TaxID=417401 RepID=A0AAN7ZRW9_9COLE
MNEEIDETEFYHQDFTTASEWEIFCARLEEIIHQWKVDDLKTEDLNVTSTQGQWSIKEEKLQFVDVEFVLSYFKNISAIEQRKGVDDDDDTKKYRHPMETLHDYGLHDGSSSGLECPLATWYGLDQFITLNFGSFTSSITSESQIKLLLSSVQLAISNTNCSNPIFVQIREKWQNCYLGVYEDEQVRTNFEMIHLRKVPQHCQYLTGLLDLFKTKIMSPINLDPINVSVQLTYYLNEFGKFTWNQDLPDVDSEHFDMETSVFGLPFGVTQDPVSEIVLKTTWSHLPDHLIVDSENYSDFDPMQAPKWSTYCKMSDQPLCLLSEVLSDALNAINTKSSIYEILGDFVASSDYNIENPLDLLTEPKLPTLSTVIKRAARNSLSRSSRSTAPLAEEILVPILYFLFPDADEETSFPYNLGKDKGNEDHMGSETRRLIDNECRGFKTCKENSLPYRLAIVFIQALGILGGARAAAHLWFEFVQEMRFRWEKSVLILGIPTGFPDPRTCLLNQKLQMLNCCIERKRARETRETDACVEKFADTNSSTDEEEFYDCTSDRVEEEENRRRTKHSLWNQPVGRLGKFENLKLIKLGDPLYIPITQEPVPKTEDQLQEDTDILLQLGSDAQGSELRAKMMSASLLSDMESFKAANPGSILDDFIRWYSPRDFIEEDTLDQWGQKKGHLSARMLIADNPWVQMWESAKPVPANRQKRLFDDTREAEKVLHFLDSRTLSQVVEMLFPILSHAAICRLYDECEQVTPALPSAHKSLQQAIRLVQKISRDGTITERLCAALIQQIAALELSVSQANSLLYKFNPSGGCDETVFVFTEKLLHGCEVEIEGASKSNIGNKLTSMFTEAQRLANLILTEHGNLVENNSSVNFIFPQANEREFVMRVSAVRPAPYSKKSPQFLRAILSKNEFRFAGAFSEDIVYF